MMHGSAGLRTGGGGDPAVPAVDARTDSGTRRAPGVALLAALALCAAWAAAPAAGTARAAAPGTLELVSPRSGASVRVTGGTLVVRLRAPARGLRADLDGDSVAGRFGAPVRGVRTARFKRGRDFAVGRGSFSAAIGKRHTSSLRAVGFTFTAWRRERKPLVIRHRRGHAALSLGVRSDAKALRWRIWVNGHRITEHLRAFNGADRAFELITGAPPLPHGRNFPVDLGAHHHLRYGRNRVRIVVEHPDHRLQRTTRTFTIPRAAPLVSAGADQIVSRSRPAILNGTGTKAPHQGDALAFRWRLVSKPRHAKVRLISPQGPRARLRARTPGHYRLRLAVAMARRHRGHGRRVAFTGSAGGSIVRTDTTDVTVQPTQDPMGVPIEAIYVGGGIQVGSHYYPSDPSKWLHVLALNPADLTKVGEQSFTVNDLRAAKDFIDGLSDKDIVVLTAPVAKGYTHATATVKHPTNINYKLFHQIVREIGGSPDTPDGMSILSDQRFSIIGHKGWKAGTATQNSGASVEAGVPGLGGPGTNPGRPGSVNGYLQTVDSHDYQFVSPESMTIDTRAEGSDDTRNVIRLGADRALSDERTFVSQKVPEGATGAQLVVLDGRLFPIAQATYTLVANHKKYPEGNPNRFTPVEGDFGHADRGDYGTGVRGLARTLWYFEQQQAIGTNALVILQTFGSGQYSGATPTASSYWVDDKLGLQNNLWNGRKFVSDDGNGNAAPASLNMWNAYKPTVAGQIGALTTPAGHDTVAEFGYGQDNGGTPNGGLTVIASEHPYDGALNYIRGQTGKTNSLPQVTGTLTRTRQGQWQLQGASSTDAFDTSALWQTAFAAPTAWPDSGPGYAKAMRYIASKLWPDEPGVTDVRAQYVLKSSAKWDVVAAELKDLAYPGEAAAGPHAAFSALQRQLVTEMRDVASVENLVSQWQRIFTDSSFDGYFNAEALANRITASVLSNSEKKQTASVNPAGVIASVLEITAAVLEFTPGAPAAPAIAGVGAAIGLAGELAPEGAEGEGGTAEYTRGIHDRADQLAADARKRFDSMSDTLDHLQDLFVSDWGRLETAARNATGMWAYSNTDRKAFKQALAVATKRTFYEGLLPLAYQEWVVSPRATSGNLGFSVPGFVKKYRCRSTYFTLAGGMRTLTIYPFDHTPPSAIGIAPIYGWSNYPPGGAQGLGSNAWYTLRVLKSVADPPEVTTDFGETALKKAGADPPASLLDPLFEPINSNQDASDPASLGIDKTAFFANYDHGYGARKIVCS